MKPNRRTVLRAAAAACCLVLASPLVTLADDPPNTPAPAQGQPRVRSLDRAASSIAVDLPTVPSRGGASGRLFKLNHSALQAWTARAATGNPRNPAAFDGRAMAGSGGSNVVYAYHITTGKRSWSVTSPDSGISNLVLAGDSVYFTTHSCTIERIQVSTGKHVFTKWINSTVECAPDVNGDVAFAAYRSGTGAVVSSHDIANGNEGWKRNVPSQVIMAPVACGDTVSVAGVDGSVLSMDGKGKTLWSRKLGAVSAPIATSRGLLVLSAAVPADTGAPAKEAAPAEAEPEHDGKHPDRITSSSRKAPDKGPGRGVTVIENRRLAVLNPTLAPESGEDRELSGPAKSSLDYQGTRPGVSGQLVVLAYSDVIRAVDLDTGNTRWEWKLETKHGEFCEPAFGDGMVFVADNYGFVTALDANNGEVVWSYRFNNESFKAKPAFDTHRVVLTTAGGRILCLPTGLDDRIRSAESAQRDVVKEEFTKGLAKAGGTQPVRETPAPTKQEAKGVPPRESEPTPASGGEEATRREDEAPTGEAAPEAEQPPSTEGEPMSEKRRQRIEERKAERESKGPPDRTNQPVKER
ncbi:MAG: PQQ-binding-like beta-propeller repeat protein [Planctomycetes bacterium]|nr:PQQ-binding-like beta-propeller repeat protein [Planctomycetota bacterium]